MKKLSLTIVAVAAMLFSVQNVKAQVTGEEETTQEQEMYAQEEWKMVQAVELPAEVQAATERDFAGATISEAYVADKEGIQTYKIVLTTLEGESKKLYADAKGNWIEKEHKKTE